METTVQEAAAELPSRCFPVDPPPLENRLSFDDCWKVVDKYWVDSSFGNNDSLRSCDQFLSNINRIPVPPIDLKIDSNNQHRNTRHIVRFEQCYIGKPMYNEDDPNRKAAASYHPKNKSRQDNVSLVSPHEAMERSLTFSAPVCYDVVHEIWKKDDEKDKEYYLVEKKYCDKLPVGDIPVPVGSIAEGVDRNIPPEKRHECPYEPKGAFIVNGTKRIIVPQSRMAYNKVLVSLKVTNKPMLVAEVRSLAERDYADPVPIFVKFRTFKGRGEETFRLKFPYVKYDIHLTTVFRALGMTEDKIICEMMCQGSNDELLQTLVQPTLEAGMGIRTQSDALVHIARKAQQFPRDEPLQNLHNYAVNIINRDLFPHMGKTRNDFYCKALFLGYVAWRVLRVHTKQAEVDDRDHCSNKRYDFAGPLMEGMYHDMMEALSREVGQMMAKWFSEGKPLTDVSHFIKKKPITQRFGYVMSTGNWTCNTNKRTNKTGVTAVIQGLSHIAAMSHARRGNTRIGREGKLSKPRQLGQSPWGMWDPSQSPEGTNIGLVFNSSLISRVTGGCSSEHFADIIRKSDLIPLSQCTMSQIHRFCRLFVNGKWIGMLEDHVPLKQKLQRMKMSMDISFETGIYLKTAERSLFISTDAGRVTRPLLVVDRGTGNLKLTKERIDSLCGTANPLYRDCFSTLLSEGSVEMLDIDEEDNAMIAMYVKDLYKPDAGDMRYTHCEIHPHTIYGEITGATIRFLNHNPPPRTTFQGAMGLHAIGVPMLNYQERMDNPLHVLYYPSKPLTYTKTWRTLKMDDLPSGQECLVVVLSYDGYNMEDAIGMNGLAVDLGLFRSTTYRVMRDTEANFGNHYTEEFKKPDPDRCFNMKRGFYGKIEADGLLSPGVEVNEDDVVTGKVEWSANVSDDPHFSERCHSSFNRSFKNGIVDSVLITSNEQGFRTVKTKIRCLRIPQVGDKFCLAEDTEVLTEAGWTLIEHVSVGDRIATLCQDNGRLVYDAVSEVYEYDHDGPMYQIQTQAIDLLTTLEHRMWVKRRNVVNYELLRASDIIGKRVSYSKNANWVVPIAYRFVLPAYAGRPPLPVKDMDSWLWFFGIWIAEGWVTWNSTNKRIEISSCKPRVRAKLDEICQALQWNPIYDSDLKRCVIYDSQTTAYLRPLSVGATNKRLPKDWTWELNKEQCQTLARAMILGDGYVTAAGTQVYYTSSTLLADDFQRLCLHAGWSCNKSKVSEAGTPYLIEGRSGVPTTDGWRLGVNVSKNQPTVNHGHVHSQRGQSEQIIQYKGKVRCVQVPSHVFLVRRNGKVVWTGNSAPHGQKGVIGRIIPPEELPFAVGDGTVPDIIINPHAFPGRMTIAMILEMLAGKQATITGKRFDATAFERCNLDDDEPTTQEVLEDMLAKAGLQRHAMERFVNPNTGKEFQATAYFGVCYYQRLKHMVDDKLHARSTGPKHIVTRQPIDGRSRDGGLRFGEMERDCLIAHGCAFSLHMRTMVLSDMYTFYCCNKCGSFAYKNIARGGQRKPVTTYRCERQNCQSSDIRMLYSPYTFKLLDQSCIAMGIDPRLEVSDSKEQARFATRN